MVKRKEASDTSSSNPLADARRNKRKKTSQTEVQVQNLWHRKSGAGYSLFVSYYGEQPLGVVVAGDEGTQEEAISATQSKEIKLIHQQGAGQSRAAKKRRKKKMNNGNGAATAAETIGEDTTSNDCTSRVLTDTVTSTSASSSKLLQAFSKKSQYSRLAPFLTALSRPLPLTFRLRQLSPDSFQNDMGLSEYSELVSPVLYDPSKHIYQSLHSGFSKASLSKVSPALKEFLIENSTSGVLARQELGSMLPVLALQGGGWLQAGNRVLDLCASPGSKTLQALEIVATVLTPEKNKRGRVIANDVHEGRLESLQEAVGRSGVAENLTSRVTYTHFDACKFPMPKSGKLFDAVIVDVPCSGDGTIRKDRHILPMWTPATGNALHELQVKILVRAIELVKVGGVVCYSTCSLNPIEDESVVAAVLEMFRKKDCSKGESPKATKPIVELMNWDKDLLPGFVRQAGVSSWKVADYSGVSATDNTEVNDEITESEDFGDLTWFDTFEEATAAEMPHARKTMWPSYDGENQSAKDHKLHLERCTRLWPQDQDSGGFFVALLRKNRSLTSR